MSGVASISVENHWKIYSYIFFLKLWDQKSDLQSDPHIAQDVEDK